MSGLHTELELLDTVTQRWQTQRPVSASTVADLRSSVVKDELNKGLTKGSSTA